MSDFKKYFSKVGGYSLMKNYFRSRVILAAINQFLVLGRTKKAFEILRLSIQLKIQNRLVKNYKRKIDEISNWDIENNSESISNKVWVCWMQGIDNAPKLVQICYQSICENLSNKEIILITNDNYKDYTNIPKYIIDKWDKGVITHTHFSDILRLDLLVTQGGLWVDSTVLCTSSNIPDYITNSNLFLYQVLKPGLDGHAIKCSSWLIYCKANNIILKATREFIYEYWKKQNRLLDYFLLHHFISISFEIFHDEHSKIPKFPNSIPHILLLQLFNEYSEEEYERIKSLTPFHKLNYKREASELEKKNTFYDVIINQRKY